MIDPSIVVALAGCGIGLAGLGALVTGLRAASRRCACHGHQPTPAPPPAAVPPPPVDRHPGQPRHAVYFQRGRAPVGPHDQTLTMPRGPEQSDAWTQPQGRAR